MFFLITTIAILVGVEDNKKKIALLVLNMLLALGNAYARGALV